ncbi:molecular chaperone DnaJ [Candidatus Parcubacteria bacterium]|nr:molecular chaperone DnaJ [Candidatus Parcubacteria bacterium]
MAKDYYHILGVGQNASKDEIKKAFRRLAHEYHPDRGGNAERFKEINAAYQVLSDDLKRSQYDRFGTTFEGSAGSQAGAGTGFGFDSTPGFDFEGLDLGDIFGEFFGARPRQTRARPRRGHDLTVELTIDFEEAFFGTDKEVALRKHAVCSRCEGTGREPGTGETTCTTCRGEGEVRQTSRSFFGTFTQVAMCSICHGRGKVAETPCRQCRGAGRELASKRLRVHIPAGIDDGGTIKLAHEGEAGEYGQPSGDLYVAVHVRSSPLFRRDGNDLHTTTAVSLTQAALGASMPVLLPDGTIRLDVPAGVQSGAVIRIRAKGMPQIGGRGRGDLYVHIEVKTPERLSRKAKKLLEELREEGV